MTPTAKRFLARMLELVQDPASGWEALASDHGSPTIRWTKEETTPSWAKEKRPGAQWALYEADTYNTYVFMHLIGGKVLMRSSTAPWVQCSDREIPFWLGEAILADPALGLDSERQNAMRHARRGGRSGDGVRR